MTELAGKSLMVAGVSLKLADGQSVVSRGVAAVLYKYMEHSGFV